ELFAALSDIVSEQCVLATNTSSLPVTAVAAGATHPERVVGMHFFNPAPVMRLLEVVAGELSGERALELARATGEAMGKTVISARYVAAGMYGRKSGRGYYTYGSRDESKLTEDRARSGAPARGEDPKPLDAATPARGEGVVVIAGEGALAEDLRAAGRNAGYE